MLGTTLRSIPTEAYERLLELVAEMRVEQPELYKEIENNLINAAEQCNSVTSVIQKLRAIRCKRRFTLEEIAERTSITFQSLWRLENSPLANPQVHTLQRFALALGYELKLKVVQKRRGKTAVNKKVSVKGNNDE
jgi:DNA-binding phage protein